MHVSILALFSDRMELGCMQIPKLLKAAAG